MVSPPPGVGRLRTRAAAPRTTAPPATQYQDDEAEEDSSTEGELAPSSSPPVPMTCLASALPDVDSIPGGPWEEAVAEAVESEAADPAPAAALPKEEAAAALPSRALAATAAVAPAAAPAPEAAAAAAVVAEALGADGLLVGTPVVDPADTGFRAENTVHL